MGSGIFLGVFLTGILALSACSAQETTQGSDTTASRTEQELAASRPNPPYFPLANGCALPNLSEEMEGLQTSVMTKLEAGLRIADVAPDIIEGGLVPSMQCGTQGAVSGDILELYLIDHHLLKSETSNCSDGTGYRGRVSTLNPVFRHSDLPRIQCAAMQLVKIGEFDVEICVKDDDIAALEIVQRANDPGTPGFTVEALQSTCSRKR